MHVAVFASLVLAAFPSLLVKSSSIKYNVSKIPVDVQHSHPPTQYQDHATISTPYDVFNGSVPLYNESDIATHESIARSVAFKRGIAYNNVGYTDFFKDTRLNKISWAYNWAQTPGGSCATNFVPMLWGLADNMRASWARNVKANNLKQKSPLLFFNEPDGTDTKSQADVTAAASVYAFRAYMQPHHGKYHLSSPCVTNSAAGGQGLDYLKQFISRCTGCKVDMICLHWYGSSAADFKNHVSSAIKIFPGKSIWITEFAPGPDPAEDVAVAFLKDVLPWLDAQNWVTHYAYFMASPNRMVNAAGTGLSTVGQLYATH